jgi:hypothetical protein
MKSAQSEYARDNLYRNFECSMDYIVEVLKETTCKRTNKKYIDLGDLIIEDRISEKANRRTVSDLKDIVKNYYNEVTYIKLNEMDSMVKKQKIDRLTDEVIEIFKNRKVTESTVYCILLRCFSNTKYRQEEYVKYKKLLMEFLLESHTEAFMDCIKQYRSNVFEYIEDENGEFEHFGIRYKKTQVL